MFTYVSFDVSGFFEFFNILVILFYAKENIVFLYILL